MKMIAQQLNRLILNCIGSENRKTLSPQGLRKFGLGRKQHEQSNNCYRIYNSSGPGTFASGQIGCTLFEYDSNPYTHLHIMWLGENLDRVFCSLSLSPWFRTVTDIRSHSPLQPNMQICFPAYKQSNVNIYRYDYPQWTKIGSHLFNSKVAPGREVCLGSFRPGGSWIRLGIYVCVCVWEKIWLQTQADTNLFIKLAL